MKNKNPDDLRKILKDAHAHFFLMNGEQVLSLKLWEIRKDSLVIQKPIGAPMRKTVVGLIPTLDGTCVYETEGFVELKELPDQMMGTIRIVVNLESVRKVNRRVYPRVSFAPPIPATITPKESKSALAAKIINLSAGGLRVECEKELPLNEILTFSFEIECDNELHSIKRNGKIVYEVPMQATHAYGVKFLEEGEEEALRKDKEVPLGSIEKTVDLINLINRLIVRGS